MSYTVRNISGIQEKACYSFTMRGSSLQYLPSSSSCICHGVGPLVDPFRSHVSRSPFKGLPCFLLPVGECCFITLHNLFRGILFTCWIQILLCSSNLSKIDVIFNPFAICSFFFVICPSVSCCSSHVFHLCCFYSCGIPCFSSPRFAAM